MEVSQNTVAIFDTRGVGADKIRGGVTSVKKLSDFLCDKCGLQLFAVQSGEGHPYEPQVANGVYSEEPWA